MNISVFGIWKFEIKRVTAKKVSKSSTKSKVTRPTTAQRSRVAGVTREEVFKLHTKQRLSQSLIAEKLGVTAATVAYHLQNLKAEGRV